MLTIREAQRQTGLSYATLQRHISANKIRSIKQGNKYLVYEDDLHLLPKPRNTGMHQSVSDETVEVPQGIPFSSMTGAELVQLEKWKTIQMMLAS